MPGKPLSPPAVFYLLVWNGSSWDEYRYTHLQTALRQAKQVYPEPLFAVYIITKRTPHHAFEVLYRHGTPGQTQADLAYLTAIADSMRV